RMMSMAARARFAVLAFAALVAGCGGPNTPEEPERTEIGRGTFNVVGTEEASSLGFNADVAAGPFTLTEGGTVEINADWTSPANNIDIFLYLGACTSAQARAGECPVANRTTSTTAKPERLNVIGVPSGSYSVGFANFGPTAETGTFTLFVTR
ncbi:MAG TPA: hypothetical protein VI669_11290, partial [Vicinamibacteria bacterium]